MNTANVRTNLLEADNIIGGRIVVNDVSIAGDLKVEGDTTLEGLVTVEPDSTNNATIVVDGSSGSGRVVIEGSNGPAVDVKTGPDGESGEVEISGPLSSLTLRTSSTNAYRILCPSGQEWRVDSFGSNVSRTLSFGTHGTSCFSIQRNNQTAQPQFSFQRSGGTNGLIMGFSGSTTSFLNGTGSEGLQLRANNLTFVALDIIPVLSYENVRINRPLMWSQWFYTRRSTDTATVGPTAFTLLTTVTGTMDAAGPQPTVGLSAPFDPLLSATTMWRNARPVTVTVMVNTQTYWQNLHNSGVREVVGIVQPSGLRYGWVADPTLKPDHHINTSFIAVLPPNSTLTIGLRSTTAGQLVGGTGDNRTIVSIYEMPGAAL